MFRLLNSANLIVKDAIDCSTDGSIDLVAFCVYFLPVVLNDFVGKLFPNTTTPTPVLILLSAAVTP